MTKSSVWGDGDPATIAFLENERLQGNWLNLAAGDGRYNYYLLEKATSVTACDHNEAALERLWKNTPLWGHKKLFLTTVDVTKELPFEKQSYDGVFCTGTLHLFSRETAQQIFSEIQRILKDGGEFIFDFATDIRRELPDGTLFIQDREPRYSLDEAKKFIRESLHMDIEIMLESNVADELVHLQDMSYTFSCNFLIVKARSN